MKEYCGEEFYKLEREEPLVGCLFEDCYFENCRLTQQEVSNCMFSGCRFVSCRIAAPKLKGTQMLACEFENCDLSGMDWLALMDQRKLEMGFLPFDSLKGCSLRHCVFFGLDLKGIDLTGADLTGSVFDSCNLESAKFGDCKLGGVTFAQNNMCKADFRGAVDYYFSLEGNRITGARFSLPEAVNLLSALGIVIEET